MRLSSIEFNNVSLTIKDKSILSDISFSLDAGKTIGIMVPLVQVKAQ